MKEKFLSEVRKMTHAKLDLVIENYLLAGVEVDKPKVDAKIVPA